MKSTLERRQRLAVALNEWCERPGHSQRLAVSQIGFSDSSISAFIRHGRGSEALLNAIDTFLRVKEHKDEKPTLVILLKERARVLVKLSHLDRDIALLLEAGA